MIIVMNNAANNMVHSGKEDPLESLRKHAIPGIIVSFILATVTAILCLYHGYTAIFQNTFYIPLLIAALYFPRKAIILAFFTSLVYVFLVLFIGPGKVLLFPALIRGFFFFTITGVTVYVSLRREKAENALHDQLANLGKLVQEQTEYISEKLERSNQLGDAYRKGNEYYELLFKQVDTPIVIWNQDLYITEANKIFCAFCKQEQSELIGRNITTILPFKRNEIRDFPVQLEIPGRAAGQRRSQWIISNIQDREEETTLAYIAIGMEFPTVENLRL